jgi:hypothetical protein
MSLKPKLTASRKPNEPHVPRDVGTYWDQLYLFPLPESRDTPHSAAVPSPERQAYPGNASAAGSSDELFVHRIEEELYVSASDSEHHEDEAIGVASPIAHDSARCTSSAGMSGSTESNDMLVRELWEGMLTSE